LIKILFIITGIVLIVVIYSYLYTLFFPDVESMPLSSPKVADADRQKLQANDNKAAEKNEKEQEKQAKEDAAEISPFLDLRDIKLAASMSENKKAMPNELPAIPNRQQSLSSLPQQRVSLPPSIKETKKEAAVKGVLTTENGSNIAIMSDGSVLEAGDTYNDGRIAYIGGDGIMFADGKKIEYK
jgi:hypothetical protein